MKVAVGAMGGDHAPEHIVARALLARPQCPPEIVLVGPDARLEEILANAGPASQLPVVRASRSIGLREVGPLVPKAGAQRRRP
jgi:phosphate acyltransferase